MHGEYWVNMQVSDKFPVGQETSMRGEFLIVWQSGTI